MEMDTIYALSTARGKAGVAVVRVSGPLAFEVVQKLTGRRPEPRRATLCRIADQVHGDIDLGLVILFEKDASFTRERTAELQIHGGAATVSALLDALGAFDGLRIAEPGEFTRRALENDHLDLAQVEGLADLIEAETEVQRRQAMRLLDGDLGRKAEGWRRDLLRAAALVEATIDFADEDVPIDVSPEVTALVTSVLSGVREEAEGAIVAERIRNGFEVAIVGPTNVGKSTLLNTLAGRDAAITSEIAGTTRDVIEVRMDIRGLAVTLLDTAGLRETRDAIEEIGIARARQRADQADMRVVLLEHPSDTPAIDLRDGDVCVVSKSDLRPVTGFGISAKTGQGIDALVEKIAEELGSRASGAMTATRQRQREALLLSAGHLEAALEQVGFGPDRAEIAAHELNSGIRALDALVGRIDVEHILGEIFANFCVGK